MSDPLDFVKNLWGSMSVPGMGPLSSMAPAMSVEDLDKKIADLKAVESWLNVNMSMLRGTIQTLEVQRGTMVTLKSMSAALAAAVKQPDAGSNPGAAAPYAAFFGQAAADTWASAAKAQPKAEAPKDPLPAAAAAAMTNPTAWWNMLQDQFTAAVSTAMSPDALSKGPTQAQDGAGQPVPKEGEPSAEKAEAKRAAARKTAKPKDEGSGR